MIPLNSATSGGNQLALLVSSLNQACQRRRPRPQNRVDAVPTTPNAPTLALFQMQETRETHPRACIPACYTLLYLAICPDAHPYSALFFARIIIVLIVECLVFCGRSSNYLESLSANGVTAGG